MTVHHEGHEEHEGRIRGALTNKATVHHEVHEGHEEKIVTDYCLPRRVFLDRMDGMTD